MSVEDDAFLSSTHATAGSNRLWVINGESESRCFAMVILDHAAEALLAFDLPHYGRFFRRINRHVADALMRTLDVVVLDVLADNVP